MSDFEKDLMQEVRNRIIKEVHKTDFIKVDYNQKKPLPQSFVDDIWNQVDWNSVLASVKPEIEKRICNAIVGNMESEIKTDVKSILSIDGVRQKLRVEVYPKIMAILNETN